MFFLPWFWQSSEIYIYVCVCVGLMDVITNKIYIVSHGGIATTGAIKTSG